MCRRSLTAVPASYRCINPLITLQCPHDGDSKLGLGFLAGIIAGAWLAAALVRHPDITLTSSPALLIAAGLIVGYGTRLGSGCTSGHGVCGLARLSPRSLAATAIFMAVAGATVFVTRHLLGFQP
ncbi:putative membrane protein YedE/YeeE [Sinorhizobium fredii]